MSNSENQPAGVAIKIAESGKTNPEKKTISKEQLRKMTKLQAQKIIKDRDPEMLEKIDREVASKARKIKRVITLIGLLIIIAVISMLVYDYLQNKKRKSGQNSPLAMVFKQ